MYWEFDGLSFFYIYVKYTFLRQFIYDGALMVL